MEKIKDTSSKTKDFITKAWLWIAIITFGTLLHRLV